MMPHKIIIVGDMAAQDVRMALVKVAQWHEIAELDREKTVLLDVRDKAERRSGSIPDSIHIPLPQLRVHLDELPAPGDREIIVYCRSGQRSYYACRILSQHGFQVRNLTGSYRTWKVAQEAEVRAAD